MGNVLYIWMHNLRAAGLAWLAGTFTFSVGGVLMLMLPLTLIGFLAGVAGLAGINPWLFMAAFTLPHGLLEIPAILLTGAAILRVGATFVTPARTIGEGLAAGDGGLGQGDTGAGGATVFGIGGDGGGCDAALRALWVLGEGDYQPVTNGSHSAFSYRWRP